MLTDFFPHATILPFQMQWEDGWYPRVPSICQNPDGQYAATLIVGDLWRPKNDPPTGADGIEARYADDSGVIRTRNFFSLLDDHLHPVEWQEQPAPDVAVCFPVIGVEEPRLFWRDGEWWFIGAIRQHRLTGVPSAAICKVGSPHVEILPSDPDVWVKNLMPYGDALVDAFQSDKRLHGGAVIPYEDGYLGVVHEIEYPARRYDQRFAWFDAAGELTLLSPSFRFSAWPLDVAAGIAFHRSDVVVSYSVQDRECYLARFPLADVLEGPCESW